MGAQGVHFSFSTSSVINQFMQNNLLRFYLFTLIFWLGVIVLFSCFHSLCRA